MLVTLDTFICLPALVLTLLCFGLPIARAQRLADAGLAGREQGEQIVGGACVAVGLAALAVLGWRADGFVSGESSAITTALVVWLAMLGVGAGTTATAIAAWREARRRRFVRRVAAGEVPGFRLRPTPAGAALERVDYEIGYRAMNTEEVAFVDEAGAVVRAS